MTSGNLHLELYLGTALHDGLAAIAAFYQRGEQVDINLIATTAQMQVYEAMMASRGDESDGEAIDFANEQAALVEGLLRGFYKQAWPTLIAQFPQVIAVEQEMTYAHAGLTFMSKPDLILSNNSGDWAYVEYKSTSSKRPEWVNSWNTAVQIHSTIKAVEATLGTAPSTVIVQGLYKGYVSYGKQSSPFCYSYKRAGNPPFSRDEFRYDYAAGFRRFPVWEMEGGVASWVEGMSETLLSEQFPQTPPLYIKEDLVEAFFSQRAIREGEIRMALEMMKQEGVDSKIVLDGSFPQNFAQCTPSFGKPCQFRQLCHSGAEDPLSHGFTWREPHHTPEAELWNEETKSQPELADVVIATV